MSNSSLTAVSHWLESKVLPAVSSRLAHQGLGRSRTIRTQVNGSTFLVKKTYQMMYHEDCMYNSKGRWMNGPGFLKLPEEQWPVQTATPHREEVMERREVNTVSSVSYADVGKVIDVKNFSSWRRLIRVTAWIKQLAE